MSNYITIESGYFLPFKENEIDPELKIWSDRYYGIIGKVHDALSENEKRYEKRYAHLKELSNRIISLRAKKEKMFNEKRLQYNSYLKQIDSLLYQMDLKYKEDEKRRDEEGWSFLEVSNYIDELKANNGDDIVEKRLMAEKSSILEEVEKQTRDQLLHSSFKDEMDAVFDDSEIGFFMDAQYYHEEKKEQDLSLWRYNHIGELLKGVFFIGELTCSEEYIDQHIKKQDDTLFSRLSELKEELRECLLHRTWKGHQSVLINESNIVWVELKDSLVIRTGVLTTEACLFNDDGYEFVHSIESMGASFSEGILDILRKEFCPVFSGCSIQEAYKNFQSNNVEKIKKDKIKCREFKTFNISVKTDFYCQYH